MVPQLTVQEFAEKIRSGDLQIVDVRQPSEVRHCTIGGAVHIPMNELLRGGEDQLDSSRQTVCYCHHGSRSMVSALYLKSKGFLQVFNLNGGIDAYSLEVDPQIPRY